MSKYLDLARGVSGPEDTVRGISGLSGITPPMAPANTRDVVLACHALGLRLSVTKDDDLRCEPGEHLTPELREAIRVHREALLYDVLLSDALRYVAVERHVEGADPGAVLDAYQDAIDAAYRRRDRPAYRAAIRAFVRAGLRDIERDPGLALHSASPSSPTPVMEGATA